MSSREAYSGSIKVGDYVKGYRFVPGQLELMYTRGWVTTVKYNMNTTKSVLLTLRINEDKPYMYKKYPDFESNHSDELPDTVELITRDQRYIPRRIRRVPDWWDSIKGKDWSTVEEDIEKIDTDTPYFVDKTMLRSKDTIKVFSLDGVLQIPNYSIDDDTGVKRHLPIQKIFDYLEKYSEEGKRFLIVKDNTLNDISEVYDMLNYEACDGLSNYFLDGVIWVKDEDAKRGVLDDLAYTNKGTDILVIDSDVELIRDIQNGQSVGNQSSNLKAVHISSFLVLDV